MTVANWPASTTAEQLTPVKQIFEEGRITLTELARREGVSIPTVWRWATRGCRGVVLGSFSIGARRFTNLRSYAAFVAACTAVSQGQHLSADQLQTPAARNRAHQQAERELDSAGLQ